MVESFAGATVWIGTFKEKMPVLLDSGSAGFCMIVHFFITFALYYHHMTPVPHLLKQYVNDVIHLFYPHVCLGCGSDVIAHSDVVCLSCFASLPATNDAAFAGNPVERLFIGRIRVEAAASAFYFTKQSVIQNLVHEMKYRGNKEAAIFLGKQTGLALQNSHRFARYRCDCSPAHQHA